MQIDSTSYSLVVPPQVLTCTTPGTVNKPALHDPVLDGAQIGQPEMRRPDHLIAVDLADQARLPWICGT
jgi:hypothetical protein